jgi:hypothetical protein
MRNLRAILEAFGMLVILAAMLFVALYMPYIVGGMQ